MKTLSYLFFLFQHPVCHTVHGVLGKGIIPHNQQGHRIHYLNSTKG